MSQSNGENGNFNTEREDAAATPAHAPLANTADQAPEAAAGSQSAPRSAPARPEAPAWNAPRTPIPAPNRAPSVPAATAQSTEQPTAPIAAPYAPPAEAHPTVPLPRYGQYAAGEQAAAGPQSQGTQDPGAQGQHHIQGAPQHSSYQQVPAPHQPTGTAGVNYPGSNSYPHPEAPATALRPKPEKKKVGMGLFAGSVLSAALVGGLVAGGSMALLGNNNVSQVGQSSQSAPLVVNNTDSVNAVTAAAAKAMPSVVTISATSGSSGGTGSGVILDTEGHILTNTHVVTLDGAAAHATIEVQTSDNKVYKGTIVGTDPLSDLAIVKIDAPNLVPVSLGDSSKINVGDTVIAIGSPLGLNGTVTDGIVSTLNRTIQVASSAVPETPSDQDPNQNGGGNGFRFSPPGGGQDSSTPQGTVNLNVIQTDAAINPGNSGGALINAKGELVGINVAIASTGSQSSSGTSNGNIGVGFSIPINHAKQVAQEIIKTGKASHGQLGVTVSGTSASGESSSFSSGATVQDVTAGSAAAKAGIKKGDIITKLGDRVIADASELTAAVREQAGGATVKVEFTRDGKAQAVDVTLDTMTQ